MPYKYCLYDKATGRILVQREDPDHMLGSEAIYNDAQTGVLLGAGNPNTQWVDNGIFSDRPTFSVPSVVTVTADGLDEKTYTVPNGTILRFDAIEEVITDGTLEISASVPATYTLELEKFPYLTKVVTVNAVEP